MSEEKYTPAEGKPYNMSEFTLGERYGSEDMYRDMGIVPGSKVGWEKDGVIYTDTVQSVSYSSGTPAIWPDLSWWQRMVRKLTPQRWRKPLQPIRPAKAATVTVSTDEDPDALQRAQDQIGKTLEFMKSLKHER